MKGRAGSILFALLAVFILPVTALADTLLVPVGQILGLQLESDGVTVVAYDDLLGHCARDAGIRIGDQIVKIDGIPVSTPQQVRSALQGSPVEITVRRGTQEQQLHLTPVQTGEGPRMGVYLRQGIAGIGTVTFYDPQTHLFGTLGHGVSTPRGTLLRMTQGQAYAAQIYDVEKGRCGHPGQLKGTADREQIAGPLLRNTPQGVFGLCPRGFPGEPIPTADYDDIQTGAAVIRTTIQGSGVQEYSVEILKIYPETRADGRNFLIKVTDPQLLTVTGGIVQGMSGSPIIQDGKLVGAVTHVLVNDPTTGYGIFIENMLDAAG